jgi:hypothetical protein
MSCIGYFILSMILETRDMDIQISKCPKDGNNWLDGYSFLIRTGVSSLSVVF